MKTKIKFTDTNLSDSVKEEMWNVYRKYYSYSKEYFLERMKQNNHFALYLNKGKIIGFAGLRIDRFEVEGRKIFLVCFGQVVINKAFRGKSLIPYTGTMLCFKYLKEVLLSDVWFWSDALTYKSYLVFVKTVPEAYPTYKKETSAEAKTLIEKIGKKYYTGSFCPETGTVKKPVNYINDCSVSIRSEDLADPDIQYFMKANPNYRRGHGLITLTPMHWKNIRILLERCVRNLFKKKRKKVRRIPQKELKPALVFLKK